MVSVGVNRPPGDPVHRQAAVASGLSASRTQSRPEGDAPHRRQLDDALAVAQQLRVLDGDHAEEGEDDEGREVAPAPLRTMRARPGD